VEDTGIGIPPEQQDLIFGAFEQQIGQDMKKYGGSGLGLTIVRRLLTLMNGEISLTSEVGKGSRFEVTLRDVKIGHRSDKESGNEIFVTELSQRNTDNVRFVPCDVVIVEDISDNRFLLTAYLDGTGVRVHTAVDGEDGLAVVTKVRPALIITDIRMPKMNGDRMIQLIRENPELKDIPILVLSASVLELQSLACIQQVQGYLRKPVKCSELITEMLKILPQQTIDVPQPTSADASGGQPMLIIQELEWLLEHDFREIKNAGSFDAITEFARHIGEMGQKSAVSALEEFAVKLDRAVQAFDIIAIKQHLNEFPELVASCRNQTAEPNNEV